MPQLLGKSREYPKYWVYLSKIFDHDKRLIWFYHMDIVGQGPTATDARTNLDTVIKNVEEIFQKEIRLCNG